MEKFEVLPAEVGTASPAAQSPVAASSGVNFDGQGAALLVAGGSKAVPLAMTMQSLFGPMFRLGEGGPAAVSTIPALQDTRSMLQDLFGAAIRESDVQLVDDRQGGKLVQQEMKQNKDVIVYDNCARYFGSAGAAVLRDEHHGPFTLLEGELPVTWGEDRERAKTPTWLLEMPAIYPNRQTLHADPRPCDPSSCAYLESNKYMLYTPSNVLRWTVGEKGSCMSNTRVVRWSDGSITLHVGSDILSLLPSQEPTLHLLGQEMEVGKAGMQLEAVVSALNPEKHLSAGLQDATSIELALAAERRQRELGNRDRNLPFADSSMPPIDWTKPRKGRTAQEEFVRKEYETREKELTKRVREGRPMTLTEQLHLEDQLQDHVTSATAEELHAEQEDALRYATLKAAQRAENARGGKRSRLNRDLNLQGGTGPQRYSEQDPFLEEDDDNVEDYEQEEAGEEEDEEGGEDSFDRQMAEMYARNSESGLSDAQTHKRVKAEPQDGRYDGLNAALRSLLTQIPMTAESFASVDGTLRFLTMEETPVDLVRIEVPKMLAEVAAELPAVDTQRVADELVALFPQRR